MDLDLDDIMGVGGHAAEQYAVIAPEAVPPVSPGRESQQPRGNKNRVAQKTASAKRRKVQKQQVQKQETAEMAEMEETWETEAVPQRKWFDGGSAPTTNVAAEFMEQVDLSHLQGTAFAFPMGTDCSGAEAPGTAWNLVFECLKAKHRVDVSICLLYTSPSPRD